MARHAALASYAVPFVLLLDLVVACSPEAPSNQRAEPETRPAEPVTPAPDLGRFEDCAVDDATFRRISELTQRLDELRTRYTERHPEVIATRQQLEDVQGPALAGCVEQLQ